MRLESLAARRLEILRSAETDDSMDPENAEALREEYDEVKAELADAIASDPSQGVSEELRASGK